MASLQSFSPPSNQPSEDSLGAITALALTSLFSSSIGGLASRLSFPAVFNFGDSNSDTGGLVAGVAFPVGPPYGQSFFGKPAGRFSDGRLIIDFLMGEMDMPFLNPHLDSLGPPDFRYGSNFATGGAIIMPAYADSINPFSFNIQISQFIRFKNRILELSRCDIGELQNYLPWEDDFRQGLYMIDIGQNDINGAFFWKSKDDVLAFIQEILSEFQTGIERLYKEGARNFWIHNTGPLGCLPRVIATLGKENGSRDQFGCLEFINRAAMAFNQQLHHLCKKFRAQFPQANVTYVDIFSIKLDLIANSSRYGFKEPIGACCGHGGPPLNVDKEIGCGLRKVVKGSVVRAMPCNNTAEYVNWDGVHYTEAANRFVSRRILDGNYTDPPLLDKMLAKSHIVG